MIAKKDWELIKAIKNHKCCGKNDGSSDSEQGGGDSGNLLMSLIPSDFPKPDLFLFRRNELDDNPVDVTNYKIDDLINLAVNEEPDIYIMCLYESSTFGAPIVSEIGFTFEDTINLSIIGIMNNAGMVNNETYYNNKTYYYYYVLDR